MRKTVIARDTGKEIPLESAFTKSKKGAKKSVYYTSEEAYKWWNEWNGKCVELLSDIVLEDGMVFPSFARNMLNKSTNIEMTYNAIELCVQEIEWAIHNKTFRSEYGQWAYIMAIVQGHFNEAVKIDNAKKDQWKRQENETIRMDDNYEYFPVKKSKNKAVGNLI